MLGKKIKESRERLGFSQKEFARIIGVSSAFLSQIESEKRTPSSKIIAEIAASLKVSVDFLLQEKDEPDFEDVLRDEETQLFFREYKNLDESDKDFIKKQMDILKSLKRNKNE